MNEAIRLAVAMNNAATNDPCAVCGRRTDPEVGPELFLDGTRELVCYECGREHAPELMRCLGLYRQTIMLKEVFELGEQ